MAIAIPKFNMDTAFVREVKAAKDNYFQLIKKKQTGDWRLFSKTIALFSLFVLTYYLLVFQTPDWYWAVPLCIVLAFVKAGIGFCVMHDAIHQSYSQSKKLNYIMGLSLNFLGANNTTWFVKHNVIHHTNVNISGYDEDIEAKPLLRMHDDQGWLSIHQFQHLWIYWMIVYSLLLFQWILFNDYKKYFTRKILYKEGIKFSTRDHFVFWFGKAFNAFVFIVFPILKVGFTKWVIGYVIVVGVTSLLIATVFQLAHVVSGLKHPTIETKEEDYFMHQISTTADFAVNNNLITWFLGGLNFQREHHLFPGVSHVHYPELRKTLMPVYKKWRVPIVEYDTYYMAVKAHVMELKRLSKKPKEIVVQL
ncbi:MAG: acyl-CoA desaturase [Candidatus Pacebacteria bacterium]|nr:acyl-CoA desaturase [Candidatus Paceibacterota bacterium]